MENIQKFLQETREKIKDLDIEEIKTDQKEVEKEIRRLRLQMQYLKSLNLSLDCSRVKKQKAENDAYIKCAKLQLAESLKNVMKEKGIETYQQLSFESGVSEGQIGAIFGTYTELPSLKTLLLICKTTGLTPNDLLGYTSHS